MMEVDAVPALKRKGADASELWLQDDGTGLPVSFRATKIRRLDADVPPVVPGAGVPPPPPKPQMVATLGVEEMPLCGDVAPAEVALAANEERAIVLYRPAEAERNLLLGPLRPGAPLLVSPDLIHGLKGSMLQDASNHNHKALIGALARDESSNLAMVPWTPQAISTAASVMETMDADQESEGTSMEVEQGIMREQLFSTAGAASQSEPLHQWPQQCIVQPPLPAPSYQPSPVTWSW